MPPSDHLFFPFLVIIGAMVGVLVVTVEIRVFESGQAERRICDREVANFLDGHDALEVQRAGILVQEIPCGISRRLSAHVF